MSWFSKKEEVPKIPPAPEVDTFLKNYPEGKSELPELPSFPADKKHENLNAEMVKSAVSEFPTPEDNEVNVEIPKDFNSEGSGMGEGLLPPKPSLNAVPEPPKPVAPKPVVSAKPKLHEPVSSPKLPHHVEPIFVRIDKFQQAQKSFENIKEKVHDIEALLRKIKDVKVKEDQELSNWSNEVEALKLKLSEIDNDIFDQL